MIELTTARLWLRPLKLSDTKELARIYADPEVARYIGGEALDLNGTHEQVSRFAEEWVNRGVGQSAVLEKTSQQLIGRIGLHYWDAWGELELGYALQTESQGKGYAAEGSAAWIDWAEANLKQEYLIAVINPANTQSLGLARRLGFESFRTDVTANGTLVHVYRRDLEHPSNQPPNLLARWAYSAEQKNNQLFQTMMSKRAIQLRRRIRRASWRG